MISEPSGMIGGFSDRGLGAGPMLATKVLVLRSSFTSSL